MINNTEEVVIILELVFVFYYFAAYLQPLREMQKAG